MIKVPWLEAQIPVKFKPDKDFGRHCGSFLIPVNSNIINKGSDIDNADFSTKGIQYPNLYLQMFYLLLKLDVAVHMK